MKTTPTTGGESTTAGGAVLPAFWEEVCEACPGWHSLYEKGLMLNEAALVRVGTTFTDAQAAIDALSTELNACRSNLIAAESGHATVLQEVERLTRERDELNDARNAAIELANSRHDALRSALMSNAAPEVDRSAERVEAARRNALEEAAKVCDRLTMALDHGGNEYRRESNASTCAAAIRALADPLQGKETP